MEPPDPEVVELADELCERVNGSDWHVWRGTNGLLYAWWLKSSAPLRWRGRTKAEVLAQVGEYIATGKRPDY